MNAPSNLKLIAAIAVVFTVAGGAYYLWAEQAQVPGGLGTICTQEAMQCPDGSWVGRTGPNCEFAPCSTGTTTAPVAKLQACPESKIINAMPGAQPDGGATVSEPPREYYVYQGQRREIAEFDANWVGAHCEVPTETAY